MAMSRSVRGALVGGACMLGLLLLLLALAIPLGGVERRGAGAGSLVLLGLTVVLAGVAGYVGSGAGASAYAGLVGLPGPLVATSVGPSTGSDHISLLTVWMLLVPVLLVGGFAGVLVGWWRQSPRRAHGDTTEVR